MRLLLPLSSILLAAAPLLGASPQLVDRPSDDTFTGTLVAADDLSVTARAENGTLVTFTVDDPSSVPAGLVAGTRVTVRYEHTQGGGLRVIREGIASYPSPVSTASTEPPPRVVEREASDTARRPSSSMAAPSPVPKSPPSLEERAEATMSLEPETPVPEPPDRSTALPAATAFVPDSPPPADPELRRRHLLLLALLVAFAGLLLIFAALRL